MRTIDKILVLIWPFIVLFGLLQYAPSTDNWYKVQSIIVHDGIEGYSPDMTVKRYVNKPFNASWTVQVEVIKDNGTSYPICINTGNSIYALGNNLPDHLNLDWWLWSSCKLLAGEYRINSHWVLHLGIFGNREVVNVSNIFKISKAK